MLHHICKTCGGSLTLTNDSWACKYCGNTYIEESVRREEDMLRSLLDEYKIEQVANLRRNLYDALNAKYIDSKEIVRICGEIKKLLPDDFMANFYAVANGDNEKEAADYVNEIDVDENFEYVDGIINFLLRSFCADYHLPLVGLVERAYRSEDLEKFEFYNTRISEEAEKDNKGVYETSLTRHVFVAYSGKDMEYVYPLVSYLEDSGLTCFVAARNLRHGKGAVQNYNNAIREAILNSKSVVFVSTPNSRSFACDALKFELPFIKQEDINNAPYEYRQNYAKMPEKYKKPRVEYRVKDSKRPNAADTQVKEFFEGCEYAYSPDEVGSRVIKLINSAAGGSSAPERTVQGAPASSVSGILDRAFEFLRDGNFQYANEFCERVLNQNPENGRAYLGKLMADLHVKRQEDLKNLALPFDSNLNYERIVHFGDKDLVFVLRSYLRHINERNEEQRKLEIYDKALMLCKDGDEDELRDAKRLFASIPGYEDADELVKICERRIEKIIAEEERKEKEAALRKKRKIISIGAVIAAIFILFMSYKLFFEKNLAEANAISSGDFSDFIITYKKTDYVLPSEVKEIKETAFSNCKTLEFVAVNDGAKSIGPRAFFGCSSLKKLRLPPSIEQIGFNAFSGCTSLTVITFDGSMAEWESIDKDSNWNFACAVKTVECTDGTVTLN